MNLIDMIKKYSDSDKTALVCFNENDKEQKISYHEFYHRILSMKHFLFRNGLAVGQNVLLIYEGNEIDYMVSLFAIVSGGAVPVLLKADLKNDSVNHCKAVLEDCGATFIAAQDSAESFKTLFPNVKTVDVRSCPETESEAQDEHNISDIMMMLCTSGSSGRPKIVPYTEECISKVLETYSQVNNRTGEDISLCCLPLHHTFALINAVLVSLWNGAETVFVKPDRFATEPAIWFKTAKTYHVTHIPSLNYMLSVLTDTAEKHMERADLSSVRAVVLAGEFVQPDTVRKFEKAVSSFGFSADRIVIQFGLTETCAVIAGTIPNKMLQSEFIHGNREIYSVGYMLKGNEAIILSTETGEFCADGEIGQICLRGEFVLSHYWNNSFEDSFIDKDGERWFNTGDIGFIRHDENGTQLFFCGRNKEILNIKGENYSPHPIEAVADSVLGNRGVSVAFSVPDGHTEALVLLVEQHTDISAEERSHLFEKIRDELVSRLQITPIAVVFSKVGTFLRTQNGKLQRTHMKSLYMEGKWNGEIISAGRRTNSDVKQFILEFLNRYMGISSDDVDTSANMISYGLNSLLSQLLLAMLYEQYQVKLTVADMNLYNSVEKLTARVLQTTPALTQKKGKSVSEIYPITDVQRAYLAGRNSELDWGGIPCQCYFEQDIFNLDKKRFCKAVEKLVQRHEALHTIILPDQTQKILSDFQPEIVFRKATTEKQEEILSAVRDEMCHTILPIDAPLFRVAVTELPKNNYRIHIQIDMLCCDAMSIMLFWNDLMLFYKGKVLSPLTCHFYEVQSALDEERKQADRDYWKEQCFTIPSAPELPWNTMADKQSFHTFKRRKMYLSAEEWKQFEKLTEKLCLTPSAAFLTMFSHTLSAFGAGKEFTLSLTTLGRNQAGEDTYRVIGDFTNLMLLHVTCNADTMLNNAKQMQNRLHQDLEHSAFTSIDIAREQLTDETIYPVVFTSFLGMEKIIDGTSPFSKDNFALTCTPQVVLDHQLIPTSDGGVLICWDIVDKAFAQGIPDKMFEVYCKVIKNSMQETFWTGSYRDFRTEHDKQIQEKVNATEDNSIPSVTLTEYFLKQAKEHSENIAVIHKEVKYTYRQLLKRASQICEVLAERNISLGDRVMIQMEKSFDLIAAIVGTVQYGAVYLPMPHDQPESRQLEIFHQSGAKCIIAESPKGISPEIPLIQMNEADEKHGIWTGANPKPSQLGYIIYTSGSTGKPKGVAIRHESAMNTILAVNRYIKLTEQDCLIGLSSVSFDLSVYDIFGALTAGASLLVPTETERIDPSCWLRLCREHNVTVWNSVPALMDIFLDYCIAVKKVPAGLSIRHTILSGDWIPMDLFDKMRNVLPQNMLTSMGGATEASIWSNYFPVTELKKEWASIPYGYPLPNQVFHISDELGRLCPLGVTGHLLIGGRGVANEYYNEPILTENAFFINQDTGERLYDTGDYGRYDENGCIIFMGRRDTQVKINGYRIELGEIQSALAKLGYESNVVIPTEDIGGKKLIAFVKTNSEFKESDVKIKVEDYLPHYFVPDRILSISAMPMTANGKIDKKKLLMHYNAVQKNSVSSDDNEISYSEQDKKILELLKKELQFPNLKTSDSLASLGINSLTLMKLSGCLESEFGHRDNINKIIRYQTINDFLIYYRTTSIQEIQQKMDAEAEENRKKKEELEKNDPLYHHPVMEIIRDELNILSVSKEDLLSELGLSSLSVIRIANKLEEYYGSRPSVLEMLRYQTVGDIVSFYYNLDTEYQPDEKENAEFVISESMPPSLRCVCEVLNLYEVSEADSFISLGVSSLEMIRIANQLEAVYGERPSIQELAEMKKFSELVNYYADRQVQEQQETPENSEYRTASQLYHLCRDAGIILWPENGKLRFKAPQGTLTPELRKKLSENKEILLHYLEQSDAVTSQELTPLQMAYVIGRQQQYALGDITAHYYVEYETNNLDKNSLQDAVNELIVRNEILRTIITPEGRMNIYQTNPGYAIETVEQGQRDLRTEMKDHQFVLGTWPMFDVKVTDCGETQRIHIGVDCLILDGWSINMFLHQLLAAYNGKEIEVTNYTFRQYLEEEQRWLRNKPYYKQSQKYWTEQIDKLPPAPHLPLKQPLEEIKKPNFRRKRFLLSEELTFAFFQRLKQYDLTPSTALCTAYMMSLSKFSTTPDVTLNLTMFNRQPIHPDVQKVLGDFTNIALIGYHAGSKEQSFLERTSAVSKELWNAIEYRSFNVINLLGQLSEKYGDTIAAPYVFTSLLDKEGEQGVDLMKQSGFTEIFAQTQTPQVLLDHQLYLNGGRLLLVLDYVEQAFDDKMLTALFENYTNRVTRLAKESRWEDLYELS